MAEKKNLKKFELPLDGKLITSIDPAKIGPNYQELVNMRYTSGGPPKGIGGMTKITSSQINATYYKVRGGIHYVKDQPSESHVLVEAYDSALSVSKILQNTTAIPSVGGFSADRLYTPSGSSAGRWSLAPDGDVAYCNGEESCVWGGTEREVGGFITYALDDSFLYDFTEQVRNTKNDVQNRAVINGTGGADAAYFYIGAVRPLDAFKIYMDTVNTSTSTMSVYYWDGTDWEAVTTLVDGTDTGAGVSLAQTGTVTFDNTKAVAKLKYINGIMIYWYKVGIDDVDDGVDAYHATVSTPFQEILDIWDGFPLYLNSFQIYSGVYSDNTLNVRDNTYTSTDSGTYAELDGLVASGTNYFLCGFSERVAGVIFNFVSDKGNTTAATALTIQYWTGSAWTSVGTLDDGTEEDSITLAKTGAVTWNPPRADLEYTQTISNSPQLYYYKFRFSQNLSSDVQVYHVSGIPAQKQISGYKFPFYANDRLLLCSDQSGKKNSMICSARDSSSIYKGADTAEYVFGDEQELMGAAWLYSQYGSSIFNVILIFKRNEIWALVGNGPDDWVKYRVSSTTGCVDPNTIQVVDMPPQASQTLNRNIVKWRAADGIYMSDGRSPIKLSEDIDDLFDKRKSTSVNNDVRGCATWDAAHNCYHWLCATGSSTTLNKEFVLDLEKPGWFEINRTTDKKLQYIIDVRDTDGATYNYGFNDEGYMYRLDYGNSFDGEAIVQTIHLGDMVLSGGSIPIETNAEYFCVMAVAKATTSNSITVTHYGDSSTTGTSWTESPRKSGYRIIFPVEHQMLGSHMFHSIKMVMSTDDESSGFEPLYFYILYSDKREHLRDWRV